MDNVCIILWLTKQRSFHIIAREEFEAKRNSKVGQSVVSQEQTKLKDTVALLWGGEGGGICLFIVENMLYCIG